MKLNCQEQCPKYELCEQMRQQGIAFGILAGSQDSMVEFEAEDGSLISSAEFFGTQNLSDEQILICSETGSTMKRAGEMLQRQLLDGCTDGPDVLTEGVYICQSLNRNEVEFTKEDLK